MGISDVFKNMKCDLSKLEKNKSSYVSEIFSFPILEVEEEEISLE